MNATLTINFSGCCEASQASCSISISRDEERNEGKTSFRIGDEIFYRIRPAGDYRYRTTNGGLISVVSGFLLETKEEDIVVSGTSVNTNDNILSGFTYSWIGHAINEAGLLCTPPAVALLGTTRINFPFSVRGILRVSYDSGYALVKFAPINTGEQLIIAMPQAIEDSEEAVYEFGGGLCDPDTLVCAASQIEEEILGPSEEVGGEQVTLKIINACNDDPVAGAQVFVDGALVEGISDVDGNINVGFLADGTHSIKITASGYTPSDEDQLANDQIEV
ncbi:MAG: hypothetical protein U9R60_16330 [Bacteroidota bacterium]|nr:hypothetical protein [Bacteroidota bacterium]